MMPAMGWACLPTISRVAITGRSFIVASRPLSRKA